jgi:hypothetical protein
MRRVNDRDIFFFGNNSRGIGHLRLFLQCTYITKYSLYELEKDCPYKGRLFLWVN